jgi:hypothetical protein
MQLCIRSITYFLKLKSHVSKSYCYLSSSYSSILFLLFTNTNLRNTFRILNNNGRNSSFRVGVDSRCDCNISLAILFEVWNNPSSFQAGITKSGVYCTSFTSPDPVDCLADIPTPFNLAFSKCCCKPVPLSPCETYPLASPFANWHHAKSCTTLFHDASPIFLSYSSVLFNDETSLSYLWRILFSAPLSPRHWLPYFNRYCHILSTS